MGWTKEEYQAVIDKRTVAAAAQKPSKYRNVKIVVDGHRFDSKREAQHYQQLKLREKAGEITDLHLQVAFPLYAPQFNRTLAWDLRADRLAVIAEYVADFTYIEGGRLRVVDAKGRRVCPYPLKAKWFALQYGFEIEEV